MSHYWGNTDFAHDTPGCTGILLTNLGTPDAPTVGAIRRYLAEFLADPRVVETPRWLWWVILHGFILRVRPSRLAKTYGKIWQEEGSPLLNISQRQAQGLQTALDQQLTTPVKVALAMRYGQPSIATGLNQLRQANARQLLVLPLYPQYSATTTASTFDAVANELQHWRWLPELRMVNHYPDHPGYIQALANSITDYRQQHGEPERLLFSFHGLPQRYLMAGDPYHCECLKTARLVAENLQLPKERWHLAFQSRFGREPWLQPYTDHTLQDWGKQGVKNVHVICPGFSADCLETLEEINMQNREFFLQAGGESFHYIPALNDRDDHINFLADLVQMHIQGWDNVDSPEEQRACKVRAQEKGASQ